MRLRARVEAPLLEPIVWMPRKPRLEQLARSSWAADLAPPRSPWEARDVRVRVTALNDDLAEYYAHRNPFHMTAEEFDANFKGMPQKVGEAPMPWHFRDMLGTPMA